MPVIKVWCLPKTQEQTLRKLHQEIVMAVLGIPELGLKSQDDITCLFPTDMMSYGLGEEIIIEVSGLFEKPERTFPVRQRLAWKLTTAVVGMFPKAHVECFVYSFNPVAQAFFQNRP